MDTRMILLSAFAIAGIVAIAFYLFLSRKYVNKSKKEKYEDEMAQREYELAEEERKKSLGIINTMSEKISKTAPMSKKKRQDLEQQLRAAGSDLTPDQFRADCLSWALIGIMGAGVIAKFSMHLEVMSLNFLLALVVGAIIGYFLRIIILKGDAKQREKRVDAELPTALEMLAASVEAGYTVERGMELVSKKTDGVISTEFGQVVDDIVIYGYSTSQAMSKLSERCDVPSVNLFVSAVTQALDQGSAIGEVLNSQSEIARVNHFQRLEEQANKIPTKMALPLVGCILPCVFVLNLAPALIQVLGSF